jgi:hypothetical protein
VSDSFVEFPVPGSPSGFCSPDCIDLVLDGAGDNTVRPLRPSLMRHALAQRERLARLRELAKQEQPTESPPEQAKE